MSKKRRRNIYTYHRKHLILLSVLFVVFLFIGLGYSVFTANLNASGNLVVREYLQPTLYNTIKREYIMNNYYAHEYTGLHQDSVSGTGDKKIYYWRGQTNNAATTILDKNNVIFGGFCWQTIRTTDTGGVKMMYNGVPSNGTCNNTGNSASIGTSEYTFNCASLGCAGYLYNKKYLNYTTSLRGTTILSNSSVNGNSSYYYGTGVTYDNGVYTLTGVTQDVWYGVYNSIAGSYTCASTSSSTCSSVYYILAAESGRLYGFRMENGNMLNDYNTNLVLGSGYTESGGVYTLTDTVTVAKADWYSNYSSYSGYYTCGDTSLSCTEIQRIAATTKNGYSSVYSSDLFTFANDFIYDETTQTYTLGNDRVQFWDIVNDYSQINYHHYTCLDGTDTCSPLIYVYYYKGAYLYYINLIEGKGINDAISEMLYDDDVNQLSSDVKTKIDTWYSNNLVSYSNYIEDTVFCGDRIPSKLAGFDLNGGHISYNISFKNKTSLYCEHEVDRYSISNPKALLTYPVAMLNEAELTLMGVNKMRDVGNVYWSLSPYGMADGRMAWVASNGGNLSTGYGTGFALNMRPVISLVPDIRYVSGDGSKNNPYVIDTN